MSDEEHQDLSDYVADDHLDLYSSPKKASSPRRTFKSSPRRTNPERERNRQHDVSLSPDSSPSRRSPRRKKAKKDGNELRKSSSERVSIDKRHDDHDVSLSDESSTSSPRRQSPKAKRKIPKKGRTDKQKAKNMVKSKVQIIETECPVGGSKSFGTLDTDSDNESPSDSDISDSDWEDITNQYDFSEKLGDPVSDKVASLLMKMKNFFLACSNDKKKLEQFEKFVNGLERPANLDIPISRINEEIWDMMSPEDRSEDIKSSHYQRHIANALYLHSTLPQKLEKIKNKSNKKDIKDIKQDLTDVAYILIKAWAEIVQDRRVRIALAPHMEPCCKKLLLNKENAVGTELWDHVPNEIIKIKPKIMAKKRRIVKRGQFHYSYSNNYKKSKNYKKGGRGRANKTYSRNDYSRNDYQRDQSHSQTLHQNRRGTKRSEK